MNLIYFIFGVIFISKSFRIIVKYKPNIIWYWNCTIIYIICFSVKPIKFIIVSVSQFIQLFSVLSDTRFIQCSLWSVRSETCVINLLHRVVGPYSPKVLGRIRTDNSVQEIDVLYIWGDKITFFFLEIWYPINSYPDQLVLCPIPTQDTSYPKSQVLSKWKN